MKSRTIFSCLLLILASSCDPNRVYEENIDFEDALWTVDNVPEFTFEIKDTDVSYNIKINIRNSLSFPFHNIYLKYNLSDSIDRALISELKEYYLFDAKTGTPQGNGLGDIFDNQFNLTENYSFSSPGKYTVDLQQSMRLDTLPMILSVGVRVEKIE